jgi:hypothetical protein
MVGADVGASGSSPTIRATEAESAGMSAVLGVGSSPAHPIASRLNMQVAMSRTVIRPIVNRYMTHLLPGTRYAPSHRHGARSPPPAQRMDVIINNLPLPANGRGRLYDKKKLWHRVVNLARATHGSLEVGSHQRDTKHHP